VNTTAALAASLGIAALAFDGAALATQINTAEPGGAYHETFCPLLEEQLSKSRFPHRCATSKGTADNVARVAADPMQLGFGQLDVFALEAERFGGPSRFTRLRVDDVRECVFAVTRNPEITNYGEVAAFASQLRFVLPPETSGSAGTFRFLQKIAPQGVGSARGVTNAASTEEALRTALSSDDAVAFFVQFPDPNNQRFKLIQELGGHVVPVIDRTILRQQLEDRKIYYAQETQVTNSRWLKAGQKVVTACTPLVVFTGAPDTISGEPNRAEHRDLIATVVTLRTVDLVPKTSFVSRVLSRTRELSSAGAERIGRYAEQAREQAAPLIEKARDATGKAIEAAKPAYEKAKELGSKAVERVEQEAREIIEKVRPEESGEQPR
jgi:hypothetical protein